MEPRGLVVRDECLENNRGSVIRVTDRGRELVAEAKLHHERAVRRYVTDVLTPGQLDALGTIADTVLASLPEPHRP